MVPKLSYSIRRSLLAAAGAATLAAVLPAPGQAQDDELAAACALASPSPDCHMAAAAVRLIHPRVGLGLWGGSPVPGTASTHGMRLGSLPRFSGSSRIVVVPLELPPLGDPTVNEGTRAAAVGLSTQLGVGILEGFSPLPTVGGLLSLDAMARGSWLLLPDDHGFDDGSVFGLAVALRLGLLRESFTLPAISLTGTYGRSTRFSYGGPAGEGHIAGGLSTLGLTGAATKRVGPVGLTAGATMDRYMGEVEFTYQGGPITPRVADAVTDRWSLFGNVSWTLLILNASLEAGWQEAVTPQGVPGGVTLDPVGWWAGAALRLSI